MRRKNTVTRRVTEPPLPIPQTHTQTHTHRPRPRPSPFRSQPQRWRWKWSCGLNACILTLTMDCWLVSRRVLGLTKEPRQRRHKEGTAGTTAHSRMMHFKKKIPKKSHGSHKDTAASFYLQGRQQVTRKGSRTCMFVRI